MSITNTTLSTAVAPIYTSSGTSAISVAYFCNTGLSTLTINVHAVSAGYGIADNTNILYSNLQITPTDTYVLDTEKLLLDNGDFLAANASINSAVVSTVSYIGI